MDEMDGGPVGRETDDYGNWTASVVDEESAATRSGLPRQSE